MTEISVMHGHPNAVTPAGQYPANLVRILERCRLPLGAEKKLQEAIHDALRAVGIEAAREVHLASDALGIEWLTPEQMAAIAEDAGIVDFMVDDVAIEVKIKGGKRDIFRQCERYCAHPRVAALILATTIAMTLPETIAGKPCFVASLSRGWM